MLIREFRAEDWAAVWPFFDEIVADGTTYACPPGLTSEAARRDWVRAPGPVPVVTVVAEERGRVVGTASIGPNRPGAGAHVATAAFMVDPAARGLGVGRELGRWALDWAAAQGFRAMQFNAVVETNTAAVRLWSSLGFEVLTTVPEAFDHPDLGLVGLHVMHRRL